MPSKTKNAPTSSTLEPSNDLQAPTLQRLQRLENKLDLLLTWVAIAAPHAVTATLPHVPPGTLNGTGALRGEPEAPANG